MPRMNTSFLFCKIELETPAHLFLKCQDLDHVRKTFEGVIKIGYSWIKFDSDCSRRMSTNTSTHQGIVLSPLLFSIYTVFITSATPNVTVLNMPMIRLL